MAGYDRVETGTRANVGLQITYQANDGWFAECSPGRAIILPVTTSTAIQGSCPAEVGRIKYLSTRLTAALKPIGLIRSCRLSCPLVRVSTIAQTRFDEKDFSLRRADIFGEIKYGPLIAQTTYSYATFDPFSGERTEQEDIFAVAGLQLTDRWSLLGSIRYDLDAGATVQDAIQLRYADDCFVLTASYTETFINDPLRQLEEDRTLMLRFELKHLGEFHYKTDALDFFFAENQTRLP